MTPRISNSKLGRNDRFLLVVVSLLLCSGILLTTATQLRPSMVPIGVGEILLAIWVVWQLAVIAVSPVASAFDNTMSYLLAFWAVIFGVMLSALAISYQQGRWDETGATHDAIALTFSAVFSITLASVVIRETWIQSLTWNLIWMSGLAMGLLLLLAARRGTFLGIDPWYAALRFTGWAKNPNQIGLLLTSLPFLAMWLRPYLAPLARKGMAVAVVIIVLAGLLSRSDALYLGWAAGGIIVATFAWFASFRRKGKHRISAFIRIFGIPGVLVAGLIWFSGPIVVELADRLLGMYELGSQGSVRLQIWSHGIAAFAESPLIGHGPGAYAGVTGSFDGFEAHNTFIDIATKTGLIGLTLYVLALATLLLQLLRTNQYLLLSALASITVFSLFHYVLRQPIYWTVVVICMRMAWGAESIMQTREVNGPEYARDRLKSGVTPGVT